MLLPHILGPIQPNRVLSIAAHTLLVRQSPLWFQIRTIQFIQCFQQFLFPHRIVRHTERYLGCNQAQTPCHLLWSHICKWWINEHCIKIVISNQMWFSQAKLFIPPKEIKSRIPVEEFVSLSPTFGHNSQCWVAEK